MKTFYKGSPTKDSHTAANGEVSCLGFCPRANHMAHMLAQGVERASLFVPPQEVVGEAMNARRALGSILEEGPGARALDGAVQGEITLYGSGVCMFPFSFFPFLMLGFP